MNVYNLISLLADAAEHVREPGFENRKVRVLGVSGREYNFQPRAEGWGIVTIDRLALGASVITLTINDELNQVLTPMGEAQVIMDQVLEMAQQEFHELVRKGWKLDDFAKLLRAEVSRTHKLMGAGQFDPKMGPQS